MGYRHFDGALVYFNEHEVGRAIREKIADGTVRREDIFYCGKVISFFICQVMSCSLRRMGHLNAVNCVPKAETCALLHVNFILMFFK